MRIQLPTPVHHLFSSTNFRHILATMSSILLASGLLSHLIGSSLIRDIAPNATLDARAKLSALHMAPGPDSGRDSSPANGNTPPYPGQVIPGFSGMIEVGDGTFYGLPDNGFGSNANSSDFLLRIYTVKPHVADRERRHARAGADWC